MPRISAPSVAEHRAIQREALISEATQILLADGTSAVTPAAVGKAVGLARSSVYEYFPSSGDLLAEVAVRAIIDWTSELGEAINPVEPGWPRLEAYVRASLTMVAEGKHEIANRLEGFAFTSSQVQRFMEHHDEISSPLPTILAEIGTAAPALDSTLVQGIVDAGAKRISQGSDATVVSERVLGMLRRGVH